MLLSDEYYRMHFWYLDNVLTCPGSCSMGCKLIHSIKVLEGRRVLELGVEPVQDYVKRCFSTINLGTKRMGSYRILPPTRS
jgi:hypothetical protein